MAGAYFSEQDTVFMDQVLQEARLALSQGGAGVAALLALPDKVITVARNEIQETGDLTSHAEMVLLRKNRSPACSNG
jgi:tRNA(Arg) A34 adenosine deaminase TadA